MSEITQIVREISSGNPQRVEQLLSLVYTELKRIAAQKMAGEAPGNTLQPTALVHEAWLKLVGDGNALFENRAHFFPPQQNPGSFPSPAPPNFIASARTSGQSLSGRKGSQLFASPKSFRVGSTPLLTLPRIGTWRDPLKVGGLHSVSPHVTSAKTG